MFEHADRHDAVESALDVAIIDQAEIRVLRQAAFERAVLRDLELLLRQRDAGDLGAGDFGEIERKPAPAAADIEHLGARRRAQLGRQMTPFGELGVVERLVGRLEIGAAILLVAVEKQRIEPAVEVVMMRHVLARPGPRIVLLQPAEEVAEQPRQPGPIRGATVLLAQQNGQNVGDRALLDDELPSI